MLLNDAVVLAFTANKAITHGFPEHILNMEPDFTECDIEPNMSFMRLERIDMIAAMLSHGPEYVKPQTSKRSETKPIPSTNMISWITCLLMTKTQSQPDANSPDAPLNLFAKNVNCNLCLNRERNYFKKFHVQNL
jgi:hypothetical protein